MAANSSDYFQKVGRSTATTLSAPGYTVGNTTLTVGSTTNWPTDTGVTFAVDTVDSTGVRIDGTYNVFRGVVSGATSITSVTYVGGDTNQNYAAGATTRVYILVSAYRDNRFVDGILLDHNQTGYHKTLNDNNGNEWIKQTSTASAVNEITIANAATGTNPVISATGGDTNVGLTITPKGSSGVEVTKRFDGWTTGLTPPTTVTYNGNGSYDLLYASSVAAFKSVGMRNRTTRTVTAPTQCTSLNGTTQYWSKASPANMSGTDDYTLTAWIKLSAYSASNQTIMSRANGTTDGWTFYVTPSGQLLFGGLRITDDYVTSYQSIPLNKWTHVAVSLDSSGASGLIYINGVLVPSAYTNNGNTAWNTPTADFRVGAGTGGTLFFGGKIAQVGVFNAVLSAATIRSYISQGMTGSETSNISVYSFSSNANDIGASGNNLTANGSATATNADSPFGQQADGTTAGTTDYSITTKISTDGLTETVQVPEGCAIPTSGGVSAMAYSSTATPYGFPSDKEKWYVETILKTQASKTGSPTADVWYNLCAANTTGGFYLTIPTGAWRTSYTVSAQGNGTVNVLMTTLSTASNTESDNRLSAYFEGSGTISSTTAPVYKETGLSLSSATPYYLNTKVYAGGNCTVIYNRGEASASIIRALPSYL